MSKSLRQVFPCWREAAVCHSKDCSEVRVTLFISLQDLTPEGGHRQGVTAKPHTAATIQCVWGADDENSLQCSCDKDGQP